jgi:hypothetical protein
VVRTGWYVLALKPVVKSPRGDPMNKEREREGGGMMRYDAVAGRWE